MNLPAQITELMRNTITWESFIGQDGHGDELYAAPRSLKCWIEEKGGSGGIQRRQSVGLTEMDPKVDVYMDASDIDASVITLRDRFSWTINGQTFKTQCDRINTMYGPDSSPWMTVVTL